MSTKKILIFAHYYFPDVASTGQLLQELAEGMANRFDITVICAVPSYEGVVDDYYKHKNLYYEEYNGVNVIRVRVPEFKKTNKLSRIINIISYFFGALEACKKAGKQDIVFTISQPPILGGVLGVVGKKLKHAKMVYNIQDFNPEQIQAVNYSKNRAMLWLMMKIDKYSCSKADLVVTVGRDLIDTLNKRFEKETGPKYTLINNWIDENKIYPLDNNDANIIKFKEKYDLLEKKVFMYSGNIGLYYDLENIIHVIAKYKNRRDVVFAFVGAGSMLDKLIEIKETNQLDNVRFIPYQNKQDLIYSLNAADIHWCVNAKGIKGVSCPSKAYGIMAVGKPIIGVLEEGSEIREQIEECGCGRCCEPGEYDKIEEIINWYIEGSVDLKLLGSKGRNHIEKVLAKDISISKYIQELLDL